MRGRILIVDDERLIRELLTQLLGTHGYACEAAPDPEQARTLLDEQRFDLLLSDLDMPGESGLKLADAALDRQPALRVVIMTGIGDPLIGRELLGNEPDAYLLKPFTSAEILTCIEGLIG